MMPIQTVKDIVKECGGPIARTLYLNGWTINYEFAPCGRDDADGQLVSDEDYRTATIRLDPAKLRDRREVCEVLLHEMLHLVINEFDVTYSAARSAMGPLGSAPIDMLRSVYMFSVERVVGNLERLLYVGFGLTGEEIADGGKYRKKGWIER